MRYLDKWSETDRYGKSAQEETRGISERDSETSDMFPEYYVGIIRELIRDTHGW